MRLSRHAVARLVVGLLVLLVAGAATTGAASANAGEPLSSDLVNGERALHGRPALRVCTDLRDEARRWSALMAREGRLVHDPGLGSRLSGWRHLGENVGWGTSIGDVHGRFLASGAHRATMVRAGSQEVGVGVVHAGGRVWVTQLYRERSGAPCEEVRPDARLMHACHFEKVPAPGFTDVGGTHRHATDCISWYGVGQGRSSTRYAPASSVTRGQLAAFLVRLLEEGGLTLPRAGDQGFEDVAGTAHADAVNRLVAAGLAEGISATAFGPRAPVTRAQTAALLVRSYEHVLRRSLPAGEYRFVDGADGVHRAEIAKAAAAGLVSGVSPSRFAPDRPIRRDQAASMLARMLDHLVTAGYASHAIN